jgi:hypothetical protein
VVPAGQLFLLGDYRIACLDSRFTGMVPVDAVRGRVLTIYWSRPFHYESFDMQKVHGEINWDRIGMKVR